MKNIQAFVGHSFTSDDEQVVGKVLKYLDAIKEVSLDFSREHAEKPETSGIDDKVLRMFEGKKVFIAICTRKELVVDKSKIRPGLLPSNIWFENKDEYTLKTSNWIIRQIGLTYERRSE